MSTFGQAADLHFNLTDVSVDDIDIDVADVGKGDDSLQDETSCSSGEARASVAADERRGEASAVNGSTSGCEKVDSGRKGSRRSSPFSSNGCGRRPIVDSRRARRTSDGSGNLFSSGDEGSGVESEDGDSVHEAGEEQDPNLLVLRTVARRPLKEMLRLRLSRRNPFGRLTW